MPLAEQGAVGDDLSTIIVSSRLKESFISSLSFLRTSQDNDDLVVFNHPILPTTLMIRLSEFINETLFLKL